MEPVKRFVSMFCWRLLCILLIAQLCTTDAYGQDFHFNGNRKRDRIRFKFIKNLIVVPLFINHKGPYNFILDTGVSPLLITDPSILDSLNFSTLRTTKLEGLGEGKEIVAFLSNTIYAKIGHAAIQNIYTVILKKDIFDLSGYMGIPIHGILGYAFFNSFLVKIKYPSTQLRFYLPNEKIRKKGEKIPIMLMNNKPYLTARASLVKHDTVALKLIIDIGASHALSLESYQQKAIQLPPVTISANLGMGIGGYINGSIGRIPALKIGSFIFPDILTSYPKYKDIGTKTQIQGRNGNLGADVLKRFQLTFDYKDLALYLKPNSYYHNAFEHDMSGMEIYLEGDKLHHYFVGRIEPDSPAALAGILTRDEIISLNMIKIDQFSLDDIINLFKSGDGKRIVVGLARNNEVFAKLLILKKRI